MPPYNTLRQALEQLAYQIDTHELDIQAVAAKAEAVAHALAKALHRPVMVRAAQDYDTCVWLFCGTAAQTTVDASTTELRDLVRKQGPINRLDLAISHYDPYAALRWRRWQLSDGERLLVTTHYRSQTVAERLRRVVVQRVVRSYGIRLVPPALLEHVLPAYTTELGARSRVARVLFSERW